MNINQQINRESKVHGEQWNNMHDGYFSDSAIARPLIEKISHHLKESRPDVVVDLGGGTGFVLQELMTGGALKNVIPVNLDCSPNQLDAMKKCGISCLNGMISDFKRKDIAVDKKIFFIMRSVLHYFGREGFIPLLRHVRDQAAVGERFINQTACFESELHARLANVLYREMATPKWYPVVSELRAGMASANWRLIDESEAPPLKLSSDDLGRRYGLNKKTLVIIRDRILKEFGELDDVFRVTSDGFVAYLHYRICVAKAVKPTRRKISR